MQYSQEHLKTMVYAEFGGQTECIMENSKIENTTSRIKRLRQVHNSAQWILLFFFCGRSSLSMATLDLHHNLIRIINEG